MRLLRAAELFRKVLKGRSKKQARLLGLDVGSKYVGLAVSDDQNRIALPLSTGAISIAKDPVKYEFTSILVLMLPTCRHRVRCAYPFNLLGQASPDAVQVRLLVGELCKTGKLDDLSYTYWDENFTSKCVQALLDPLKLHDPVETKTMISLLQFAYSSYIHQGYLDNMNRELRSADNSEE